MIHSDIIEYNIVGDTKNSFFDLYSFRLQKEKWTYIIYMTVHELSIFCKVAVEIVNKNLSP